MKDLNYNLGSLLAVRVVRSFAFAYLNVILPIYLYMITKNILFIGLVFTVSIIFSASLSVLISIYGDRNSRKLALIVSSLTMPLSLLILSVTANPIFIAIAVIIGGVAGGAVGRGGSGFGPFQALVNAIVADETDGSNRTKMFSKFMLYGSIAGIAGSILVGATDVLGSFFSSIQANMIIFFFLFALTLISSFLLFGLKEKERKKMKGFLPKNSGDQIKKLSVLSMMRGFSQGLILPYISLWFVLQFNATPTMLSIIFGVSALISTILYYYSPMLEKRLTTIKSLVYSSLAGGLMMIIFPFASFYLSAVLFCAFNGFLSISIPINQSFSMDIISSEERSSGSAIQGFSRNIPYAATTYLGSYLLEGSLYALSFAGRGVLIIANAFLYEKFFSKTKIDD
jgi:MFS family permease